MIELFFLLGTVYGFLLCVFYQKVKNYLVVHTKDKFRILDGGKDTDR